MLSEMGVRAMISGGGEGFSSEDLGRELSLLLREQRRQESSDRERELNIYRSGSAPPTVEGSLTAMGALFGSDAARAGEPTEEDLRSHPDYVSYYYANVNLNPRLPPPVLSKEDWRFARRFQAGGSGLGGIGDRSKLGRIEEGGSRSLFSMHPGFSDKELDDEELRIAPGSSEWMGKGGDGLIGLPGLSLGRQRSFADLFQDDQNQRTSVSGHSARPASRSAYEDCVEPLRSSDTHLLDGIRASTNVQNVIGHQNNGSCATPTFASVVGSSLSRSNTPDPQLAARVPSPRLPPVGVKMSNGDKKSNASSSLDRSSSTLVNSDDLMSALSGMKISNASEIDENVHSSFKNKTDDHQNFLFDLQSGLNNVKQHPFLQNSDTEHLNVSSVHQSSRTSFPGLVRSSSSLGDFNSVPLSSIQHAEMTKTLSSNNSYPKGHSATMIGCSGGSPVCYPGSSNGSNASFTTYGLNGYAVNSLPSMMSNQAGMSNLPPLLGSATVPLGLGSPGMDARNLGGCFSSGINLNGASDMQNLNKIGSQAAASSLQLPLLDPLYIQYLNAEQAASNYHDPSIERGFMSNSYADLLGIQKAYLGALLQPQKQFGVPLLGKSGYYGNSSFGLGVSYPGSPVASPILSSSAGPVSPLRHGERNMHFPTGMRNIGGNVMGSWHLDGGGSIHEGFASSLLEEFKNNKTKCYELSDIEGHVVEFSADQYGSRFIQQKLESATPEEKPWFFLKSCPMPFL
ncbi:hypothetical protein HPP92_012225 [Vanilla planifolia]|uniref:PUM-HD domain-containing protein n=1 Tax=Vanilla planifolia TaxID=51239 RepID=A0A835R7L2_VANPL|nr:hypothetical protein HPP92_012225 [Vanilla planifolia]